MNILRSHRYMELNYNTVRYEMMNIRCVHQAYLILSNLFASFVIMIMKSFQVGASSNDSTTYVLMRSVSI